MRKDIMKFKCYVWGSGSDWVAICTDLDIAVQGNSFNITKKLLNEAIDGFLHEVMKLPENERKIFLKRRAPLFVRIKLHLKFHLFRIRTYFLEVSSKFQMYSFSTSHSAY